MEIKCLTNAGAWLKYNDTNILIDPWINDGKLGGALHTLPPMLASDMEILRSQHFDAIYISHAHEDHFDLDFLLDFKDNFSKVLIGDIGDSVLKNVLTKYEVPFIECACEEYFSVGDISLAIIPPFRPNSSQEANALDGGVDTSLVVKAGTSCVFFAIDNPMTEFDAAKMQSMHGPFDVAFLPYTGASHYPSTYASLSSEEKSEEIHRIRRAKLQRFCELAREMPGSVYVPFAGSFITYTRHSGSEFQVSTPLNWFSENLETRDRDLASTTRIVTKWDTIVVGTEGQAEFLYTDNHFIYLSPDYLAQRIEEITRNANDSIPDPILEVPRSKLLEKITSCNSGALTKLKKAELEIRTHIYIGTEFADGPVYFRLGNELVEEVSCLNDLKKPYHLIVFQLQDLVNFVNNKDYWKSLEYKTFNYRSPNIFDPVVSQFFSQFKPVRR